jgi:polo-like kinase 1
MTRNPIPKNLPASTLAVPPKSSYLKQFQPRESRKSLGIFRIFSPEALVKHLPNKPLPSSKPESPHHLKDSASATSRKIAVLSYYSPLPSTTKVFVKKWVDYSNKYGLGYVMSNNFIGVYFNDHSKFICNLQGEFQVIQKGKNDEEEKVSNFSLFDYPEELKKKVTLLEHFRKYLVCEVVEGADDFGFVYIKKWLQTDHATIFRLSDKTVQIRFTDMTEMVLSSGLRTVAYLNRNGKSEAYPMSTVMTSDNPELIKRINYTSEMISKMLSQKK